MSEKDKANLLAIIDSAQKILNYVDGIKDADAFYADQRTFDAVLMNFVVIGESVSRISDQLQNDNPDVPWRQIKGFRNIIAHDYFGVDAEEVWQIIESYLGELIKDVEGMLNS